MTGVVLLFLLGLVLMIKGGDSFVEGAEWMARATGIPPFVVAATVVSLGTTMPELLVSSMAAAQGSGAMALGNAVGSVSCNTGLILGISILFLPGKEEPRSLREKGVLLLFALLAMLAFGIDGRLTWREGLFLLVILLLFFKSNLDSARRCLFPREETGAVHILPLSAEIASVDILPVWGHVKRGKYVCAHQHLNVSYLLTADEGDPLRPRAGENTQVAWLDAERMLEITNEWQMDYVYTKLLDRARSLLRGVR